MQAGSENQLIVIIKGRELCIEQNNYISRTKFLSIWIMDGEQ